MVLLDGDSSNGGDMKADLVDSGGAANSKEEVLNSNVMKDDEVREIRETCKGFSSFLNNLERRGVE